MRTLTTIIRCLYILTGVILSVNGTFFRCYKGSINVYKEVPLSDIQQIVPYLDKSKPAHIYIFGFNGTVNGPETTAMTEAYVQRDDVNYCILNWEEEAHVVTALQYPLTVIISREVAEKFGEGLIKLNDNGILVSTTTLIGHSLGAHMAGWAGEKVMNSSLIVYRIMGLDPAGPLFGYPFTWSGLNKGQAVNVAGLHTNPGEYGINKPVGTVDFYANCNYDSLQPGCTFGTLLSPSNAPFCSHKRAVRLYAEAVLSNLAFPAAKANSCNAWQDQNNNAVEINYLGDKTDFSKPGYFYFSTKSTSPYSRGTAGLSPA